LKSEGKTVVKDGSKTPAFDECIFGLGECPVKRYLAMLKQEQEAAHLAAFCRACVWVKALKAVDWFEK